MLKDQIREMFFISKEFLNFKNLIILKLLCLFPLAFCFTIGYFFKFPLPEVTNFLPVKIYTALFFILLLVFCMLSIFMKRWGLFLIGLGLFLVVLNFFINIFFYFRGFVYIGEGESFKKRYVDVIKGAFGKPPVFPLVAIEIQKDKMILMDIRGYELKKEGLIKYGDFRITLNDTGEAPLLTLYDKSGTELESALFMMTDDDANYFQFSNVPHQFYLKPHKEKNMYSLRIMRGKLTMFKGTVSKEDKINFEEFYIIIRQGSKWALLKVEREKNYYLYFLGLGLLISGIFIQRRNNGKISSRID